jgi:L-iditol 2-dehydrogenase
MCREGRYNICKTLDVYGCQAPGASADYYAADEDLLYVLPDNVEYDVGTVIEPLAVGVGAVRRPTGGVEGKNVLVIGAGTIGNVVMQSAKALGAKKVIISDVSDFKLNMAKECGADVTVNVAKENLEEVLLREFGEDGLDVCFECSANGAALNQILRCGRKAMQFVIVAVYGHKPEIEMGLVQDREYEIYGTLMYLHEDYEKAIRLVEENKVNLQMLISKEYALEDVAEAYKYIEENRNTVQKVILNV